MSIQSNLFEKGEGMKSVDFKFTKCIYSPHPILYPRKQISILMSDQNFTEKFRKERYTLERAIDREVILPIDKPKLWKKIIKFYEEQGVQFYGEIETDYIMILDKIAEEYDTEVMI
jgi:hypothetical protein